MVEEEVAAQRERLFRLCEACLRLNESLDLEVVLQETLDSARALTGAGYGVIALVDDQQEPVDYLSSGFTPEQAGQFWELPETRELFDFHFGIEEPLRLLDFQSHLSEQGLPEFRPPFPVSPAMAFLATPIRHRDHRVGAIFVVEKEGGFSPEDEETLVMFTSQAALAISNARRYRQAQWARSDLEALVNTAPMAVLAVDAKTGELRSVNRVARQIVRDLNRSGGSLQDLIREGTYRRADGRVISQKGLSLAEALGLGETVRDEEVIIEFPDGQNFVAMVNATPVHSAEGAVESVIVTVQDMTPLAEMERLRTEFLGMVGHELRSPLTAIKGSTATLLEGQVSLDPAEMVQYHRIIDEQADYMRDLITDLTDVVRIETGMLSVSPVPLELSRLVDEGRNTASSIGGCDIGHRRRFGLSSSGGVFGAWC